MLKIRYIIFVALATATSAGLIDTNDCPTVYGGITQSQCSTFAVSATFEDLCGAQNYFDVPGSQVCDVHCQCFHGAVWGQCLQRPSTGPVGSVLGFGNQYCTCYYEGDISPPTGWQNSTAYAIGCSAFKNLVPLGCATLPIVGLNICLADCVCTHGFKNAVCTTQHYGGDGSLQCVCLCRY